MGVKYDTMLGQMRDTDTVGDVDGLQDALNGKTSAETTNACTNIKATQINNKVYINWTDPATRPRAAWWWPCGATRNCGARWGVRPAA